MTQHPDSETDEGMCPTIVGHILIRDAETGEVLLNQRDNAAQNIIKGNSDAAD